VFVCVCLFVVRVCLFACFVVCFFLCWFVCLFVCLPVCVGVCGCVRACGCVCLLPFVLGVRVSVLCLFCLFGVLGWGGWGGVRTEAGDETMQVETLTRTSRTSRREEEGLCKYGNRIHKYIAPIAIAIASLEGAIVNGELSVFITFLV